MFRIYTHTHTSGYIWSVVFGVQLCCLIHLDTTYHLLLQNVSCLTCTFRGQTWSWLPPSDVLCEWKRQHVGGANSGMHAPARRTTTMEVIGQLPLLLWKWKCERRETRVKKEYIMMSGCIWHNQSSYEWVCWKHSYFPREKTHLTILV